MSSFDLSASGNIELAIHSAYSNPSGLTWADASADMHTFYDPTRVPEDYASRQLKLVNWLADESFETAQADLGHSEVNGLESVGYLSYLTGAITVRSLAPVGAGIVSDTFIRPDGIDYVAGDLGITRDALVERLLARAFKVVHELGDLNWFVNYQSIEHSVDPLDAVRFSELTPPSARSWLGRLSVSDLSLPEFSDLITTVALGSRIPRGSSGVTIDRVPEAGRAVVEDKINDVKEALERQSLNTDLIVDLIGCSLVYTHGILDRCLNTEYSEMVYFNLMKLLARYRQQTTFAHEPDSLETSYLLSQWQPWLPKRNRDLPRSRINSSD